MNLKNENHNFSAMWSIEGNVNMAFYSMKLCISTDTVFLVPLPSSNGKSLYFAVNMALGNVLDLSELQFLFHKMRVKPPFSEVFIVITEANLYEILCTEKTDNIRSSGNAFTPIQVIFNLKNCSVVS